MELNLKTTENISQAPNILLNEDKQFLFKNLKGIIELPISSSDQLMPNPLIRTNTNNSLDSSKISSKKRAK